ncbi:peptidase S41 family protein-like protein [Pyrenochaeta sp. DS3sAY3a]|nr:peptidase S41 family protein-like protein [Pyrenochaeta sp. DS3sAY3a]
MRTLTALSALIAVVTAQLDQSLSFELNPTQAPTSIRDVEPSATETISGPIPTGRACRLIADFVSDSNRDYPSVEAELAYACLKSVPILNADASFTVDAIKQMAEFQSTLAYLKDPPQGWPNEAVDIMAGLDDIKNKVNDGTYTNQYDFENDIAGLFIKAHDGHLNFNGMAYSGAFRWRRNSRVALISASSDGTAEPKIWALADFNKTNRAYEPSPVTQINGQDVGQFLEDEAKLNAYHDPDTRYNAMFFMQSAENFGYFTNPRFYPGPNTSVTFENGTTDEFTNAAIVLQPSAWRYIRDPNSFYETYIYPSTSSARVKKRDPNALPMHLENPRDHEFRGSFSLQHGSVPMFYPKPFVSHSADLVPLSGYFINTGAGEIGVLAISTFNTDDVAGAIEFQSVVQEYISQSKARGIEKHIIDVRGNGGGKVISGYDVYLQFFPSQIPQTQSRYRGHPASELFGDRISSFTEPTVLNAELFTSPFSNDAYVSASLEDFPDWAAMYPPDEFKGDKFTALLKYNLSDQLTTSNARLAVGITVTGYNDRSNFTEDPFRAEDLIILSDGICASTCSIFLELMVQQSHVRTLAIGGRPTTGPMVPVGGTKGTLVLPSEYLVALSQYIVSTFAATRAQAREWAAFIPNPFAINYADASVNFQDNIRAGLEKDGIPTQFLNDTASCRVWYTANMYLNVSAVWDKTAAVAFGGQNGTLDESACVAGSVTTTEQQNGLGDGNPSTNGTTAGGNDKADGAIGVRARGWVAVVCAASVVVGLMVL